MAQSRGIRIHQYVDDWLIRAPTKESCHQGTQSLLALCQELGWNIQNQSWNQSRCSEFVGYQYDLLHGLVKPTQNCWEAIFQKMESILANPTCRVRKFMSLIGLLTATEKQVPLARLHMRTIQWHLKRHWGTFLNHWKRKFQFQGLFTHIYILVDQEHLHPLRHAVGLGCSLRRLHGKRHLVHSRKPSSFKFPGSKSCLAGPKYDSSTWYRGKLS